VRHIQRWAPAPRRNLTRTYRWVAAWLVAGAVLALLLLANSIRDYLFVWRLLAVQQVRRELSQQVVALEQRLRRAAPPNTSPSERLAEVMEGAGEEPLWTELRSPDGLVLARRGSAGVRTFSKEEESAHFRNRQALYKVVPAPLGEAVVEAFPVFSAGQSRLSSPTLSLANPPAGRPSPMVLEVAAPLSVRDPAAIWPIRRNLAINCSGALALLATVVVAGLGFRSYARGRRLEQQMEIARQVQSELLPSGMDVFEPVRVATVYRPAEQVGGDFYDVFLMEDARIGIVMGDVSGKGMPAALVTGVMHGAVRSSAWSDSPSAHERESLRLNSLLCEKPSGSRYASMLWCYYDPRTRVLSYVNAGHYPPLLIGDRGRGTEIWRLDAGGGPVLGLLPAARYEQAQFEVRPGDVLVLYSDGLTEAANPSGEEYGEGRLRALLATAKALGPDELCDAIVASASAFAGAAPLRDDLTLVVAKFA
jgi:Stage II sporulation protein E (SpoIIE)